jgi:hypothetical protein
VDIVENPGRIFFINPYAIKSILLFTGLKIPATRQHPFADTRQPCTFRGKTHAQARAAIQLIKDQF